MLRIVPQLYPVSAAHTSIFRMDSNSTSYGIVTLLVHRWRRRGSTSTSAKTLALNRFTLLSQYGVTSLKIALLRQYRGTSLGQYRVTSLIQ